MSAPSFRFLHATNLRLDQPLWGIGEVDGDIRRLAEDATLIALERICDACVDHQADFLLLTGNCFDASGLSLRAQSALEDGFAQLAHRDIEAFIAPGQTDPPSAWTDNLRLPPGVTVVTSSPVSVACRGRVLATIELIEGRRPAKSDAPAAFHVGLLPAGQHADRQMRLVEDADASLVGELAVLSDFHYVALGDGAERRTVRLPLGMAHDPGSPQSLDGRGVGSRGCSLVEVDADRRAHPKLLPTAIIRWERIELRLGAAEGLDELAEHMQAALIEREPAPGEKVWMVQWIIEGSVPLVNSLEKTDNQRQLCELVERELADDRGIRRLHQLQVSPAWHPTIASQETDSLLDEFLTLVRSDHSDRIARFGREAARFDWPSEPWVGQIVAAAARLEADAVLDQTCRLGRAWLGPTLSEE